MTLAAQINDSWTRAPYPGDDVLSDCWCDECEDAMCFIRGKSWMELEVDNLHSMHSRMEEAAFLYYLPGMLLVSLDHPDELHIPARISAEFSTGDLTDPTAAVSKIESLVGNLDPQQRQCVVAYLDLVEQQGWQAPVILNAARDALRHQTVKPFSSTQFDVWIRQRLNESSGEQHDAASGENGPSNAG